MIRAVLDASILVSAVSSPQGKPGQIVRSLVEDRSFALILSPELSAELERALFYPRIRERIRATDDEIRQWVASLSVIAEVVTPTVVVSVVDADPDDDKYVAAALEGRAHYLVSGDTHLLDLTSYQDVQIVTAREFLAILGVPSS
jgi:putative PIN family toxin of toxin-antitoxin system